MVTYSGIPTTIQLDASLLERYVNATSQDECQFWGVNTGNPVVSGCTTFYTREQRLNLSQYLNDALDLLEPFLNFTLRDRWFVDEPMPYMASYHLRWCYVKALGKLKIVHTQVGIAVDLTHDPAEVIAFASPTLDSSELRIFHPGTQEEIIPSSVVFAGNQCSIFIPRCRLVTIAAQINDEKSGLDYQDDDNFEDAVDIDWYSTDASDQITFIKTNSDCDNPPCTEETETGCGIIMNSKTSFIKVYPATWSRNAWSARAWCAGEYSRTLVSYKTSSPNIMADRIILQLAHALMPEACGCDYIRKFWAQARTFPDNPSPQQSENPFGIYDGAYAAYRWAQSHRIMRAGIL